MRLSRILMFPFAVLGGYIAYEMVVNYRYEWSWYLAVPIVILAALFSLHPQIDAIGYRWWKPKVDEKLKGILKASSPSFAWVKPEDQDAFISDLLLQCRKTEFIGKHVEDVPTDIQVMCLYPGKLLEYLFGIPLLSHFTRVVLYKHPFPSPQYKTWHTAEAHHEDGVILFSLEQLINTFAQPGKTYHIGFDAWIRGGLEQGLFSPEKKSDVDESIFSLEEARKYLGLQHIPPRVQHLYAFLLLHSEYVERYPELSHQIKGHLVNPEQPEPIV